MTRRLLVFSPHFPPVNAADHQRVRMMLPHLAEFGWEAHVLAFRPDVVEAACDANLLVTTEVGEAVTRVGAVPYLWTRRFGLGSLAIRGGRAMLRAARRVARERRFDAAFVSTTILGAIPFRRGPLADGLPYVLDIQDPWVNDYYRLTGTRPPGGRLRYALAQWEARRAEPSAMRRAAHVVCVSPAYPDDIRSRAPDVPADRFSVVPFAASMRDFDLSRELCATPGVFDPADGLRHWVYLGRGGADMAPALRGLFTAVATLRRSHAEAARLRLHFVGTSYAPPALARETVAPVAAECGVADMVSERTGRVPYFQGLGLLRSADAVLVVGSDDPSYSASKVYPCVAAGRPILAVLRRESAAGEVIERCDAGRVVRFDAGGSVADLAARLRPALEAFLARPAGAPTETNWVAFEPFTARAMTRRLCGIFDRAVRP